MRGVLLVSLAACAFAGCRASDPGTGDSDTAGTGGESQVCAPDDALISGVFDDSACVPEASDYQPRVNMSADDPWPACISDAGVYELVGDSPSSIGRVAAYEQVADLLWRNDAPTVDDFTTARTLYAEDQGLESRVLRREDLHAPPIPEADWESGVDPDKQCSVPRNVEKYPQRCAGPALVAPLLDEAFAAGQMGQGDPEVLAAQIRAGLDWFLWLSVFKEANTCATNAAKDCDSTWAYYGGGSQRAGGDGFAGVTKAASQLAHDRIFDAVLAMRCWRDLYPEATFPTIDDVDAAGQTLFDNATAQLDAGLQHGLARVVRESLLLQGELDEDAGAANWAYAKILGPVLGPQAQARDATAAAMLAGFWTLECPTAAEIDDAIAALDAVFPCP